MDEFLKSVSTEMWGLITIATLQIISFVKGQLTRRKLSSDVQVIKTEVSHNGGESNTLSDKVDRIAADVKELKDSVKSIKVQDRAKLELTLNISGKHTLLFDKDGKCTFANISAEIFTGLSKDELMYDGWLKMFESQSERERIIDSWERTVKRPIAFDVETTVTHQGSQRANFKVNISSSPVWDDVGNPIWFLMEIKTI